MIPPIKIVRFEADNDPTDDLFKHHRRLYNFFQEQITSDPSVQCVVQQRTFKARQWAAKWELELSFYNCYFNIRVQPEVKLNVKLYGEDIFTGRNFTCNWLPLSHTSHDTPKMFLSSDQAFTVQCDTAWWTLREAPLPEESRFVQASASHNCDAVEIFNALDDLLHPDITREILKFDPKQRIPIANYWH